MLGYQRLSTRAVVSLVALSLIVAYSQISIWAGHRNFRNAGVGGISIDAEGVLRQVDPASKKMVLNELRKDIQQAPAALLAPNGMRMVSLRGLQNAIRDAQKNNLGQLPEEVRFLAGLQRIQYVLVYPEEKDIVLAIPRQGRQGMASGRQRPRGRHYDWTTGAPARSPADSPANSGRSARGRNHLLDRSHGAGDQAAPGPPGPLPGGKHLGQPGRHGTGHERGLWPPADPLYRCSGNESFCPRDAGSRLQDEADRHEA